MYSWNTLLPHLYGIVLELSAKKSSRPGIWNNLWTASVGCSTCFPDSEHARYLEKPWGCLFWEIWDPTRLYCCRCTWYLLLFSKWYPESSICKGILSCVPMTPLETLWVQFWTDYVATLVKGTTRRNGNIQQSHLSSKCSFFQRCHTKRMESQETLKCIRILKCKTLKNYIDSNHKMPAYFCSSSK